MNNSLDKIIVGNARVKRFITQRLKREDFVSAYIFEGPSGVGKRLAADYIMNILIPEKSARCYATVIDKAGEPIFIEDIRQAERNLRLKNPANNKKVVLVDHAELMTVEAQNAFLKTLEEPAGDALIILITETSGRLLPTIRSRCQLLRFEPISRREMKDFLAVAGSKLDRKQLDVIVEYAGGSVGRALELINTKANLEFDLVKRLLAVTVPDRFAIINKEIESRSQARRLVRELMVVLRIELMAARNELNPAPVADFLEIPGKRIPTEKVLRAHLNWARKIRDILGANVNVRLALENLWLNI